MAVYTALDDQELHALLAQYDLGRARAFKGIAEGVENSNFYLETDAGRFVLTIFEKRVTRTNLPFFMGAMEAAAQGGVPSPEPQRGRDGAVVREARGKPCAIVSFLAGVSPRTPSVGQCAAIGRTLAALHRALAAIPDAPANPLGPPAWDALVRPRLREAEALRPGLAAALEADLAALQAGWPMGLPQGVIHADLFPDNALFLGDQVTGVIDFYFACRDALAYDVAVCLNAWCFSREGGFDRDKGAALLAGYQSVRPLTPPEAAALPMLARGAAMRFFATRLADWTATPPGALVQPKDPLDYAARLAVHRGVRDAAAYGLTPNNSGAAIMAPSAISNPTDT